MTKIRAILASVVGVLLVSLVPAGASGAAVERHAGGFPDSIPLPTGFQPEGIATGSGGASFFVGSIPTGAIFRGSLRSGRGDVLVPGGTGRSAIGLEVDRGRVFVAGGETGNAWVYDAHTGEQLAAYRLATGADPTFINDVVVTRTAAWFTDSLRAVLYRVPVGPDRLGGPGSVRVRNLTGDYVQQPDFNANGIETTPDGRRLIIVQSNTGMLFRVVPSTGVADRIELTGGDVAFGDGLLRAGRTLFVVQNQLNRIAVVQLGARARSGDVVDHLTDTDLDVPTTIARFRGDLYAVNARFGVADPAEADYAVVRVDPA